MFPVEKKINLIQVCKILNLNFFDKKIKYGIKGGRNLFGNNKLLKSLGKRKFKNIENIIRSFKKWKKLFFLELID